MKKSFSEIGIRKEKGLTLSILFLLILFIFSGFGFSSLYKSSKQINSFSSIQSHFKNPPSEYRSAPLWVWNDQISESKIDRQLEELKENGIGGVFVHPRPGLITPYLTDHWFDLFRYTVKKGEELGMKIWIYDENSYPSGFAGGHVPAEMPESVNQGQGLKMSHSTFLPESNKDYYLILEETPTGFLNITADLDEQKKESAHYYLFEKVHYDSAAWYGGFSYVDLLIEGVTEKFIEVTMRDGYEKVAGDDFGNSVPGIFTDEPNIAPPGGENIIRWTPDLFDAFYERWGYNLEEQLPSLYEEVGSWRKVRHNYYSLLLDLFIERWSKPWNTYTEEHNLQWTGHYWEHGWPNPNHGGDNMAMYAWHQVPGIDILFNNYQEEVNSQFGNVRAVKEVSSIANQMGRNRTLSETYGGGGWNLRFQDMKRIGDWIYVLGVNFLNQHHSFMTIKGNRKRDYPQSFSYHEPWWEYYQILGDYYGRLSLALSTGKQVNKILVIQPTTSAWMYFSPDSESREYQEIGEEFQKFVVEMEAAQNEYDLGSERIISEFGSADNGKFTIGERTYDLVIFPPGLNNLDQSTVHLIENYLNGGGKILSFVSPPEYVGGEASNKIKTLQAEAGIQWHPAETSDISKHELLQSENFRLTRSDSSYGNLFHRRMQLDDGQFLFLVNTSEEESAAGEVDIAGGSVEKLDLVSGEIRSYPSIHSNEKTKFSFDLPPVGSLLLYVSDEPIEPDTNTPQEFYVETLEANESVRIKRGELNTLTLDYLDLTVGEHKSENINTIQASNMVFEHFGFTGNPWYRAVQYKNSILEKNDFNKDSGFNARFTFTVEGLDMIARNSLQAVVEQPTLWNVFVNGHQIDPVPEKWWLDRSFGVYQIGEQVKDGENHIIIEASPMSVFAELESVYVLGAFSLESFPNGWKIIPDKSLSLGEWSEQGMPFYPNEVSYTKTYSFTPEEEAQYIIQLEDWLGTVAAVQVNGMQAGIIGWLPYELDVSKWLKDGENEITVKVVGSLKNLLGPHHNNPERSIATPFMFEDAPEHQPPGEDYDVIGYGLKQDFSLEKKIK